MIQTLKGFPGHVVAFLCSGRVTRREYDTILIPAVRAALQAHPKVRLYYEAAPDFSIESSAVWEDFKFGIEHLSRWERFAIVTDVEWIRQTMRAFSFVLPSRLKVFPRTEVAHAREWITAANPE